jgi:protein-tyrosine phosphatase
MPELYWIEAPKPGRLAVMPAPIGGRDLEEEILQLRMAQLDTVVSCLELHEAERLGLALQPQLCRRMGIDFLSLPTPDHTPPAGPEAVALVRAIAERFRAGRRIAVHCYAGIGRSVTFAGGVLRELGIAAAEVFARLERARGFEVPETPEQFAWIEDFVASGPSKGASPG